jgi:hypothetical protein
MVIIGSESSNADIGFQKNESYVPPDNAYDFNIDFLIRD